MAKAQGATRNLKSLSWPNNYKSISRIYKKYFDKNQITFKKRENVKKEKFRENESFRSQVFGLDFPKFSTLQ